MKCSIAVAPCFAALDPAQAGDGAAPLSLIQLTPAGRFAPNDGRKGVPAGGWCMDEQDAARCIAAFDATQPPVIDYEHQTLHAATSGQPAPAAGFIRRLVWRAGQGLFAEAELTARARQYVQAGEYRYFSPVFQFNTATGHVQRILMGAFTNNPAISGMQPLTLAAAAAQIFSTPEENYPMNKDTAAPPAEDTAGGAPAGVSAGICSALGIAKDASEADAISACAALVKERDEAVAAAKAATESPDPARFAPVEALKELQAQVAALTSEAAARMVDDLVQPALADGRLLPAQEKWARELGGKDVAALKAYLDTAQPISALTATQTGGKAPEKKNAGLCADELKVAAACGITPENFAAARDFMAAL